MEGNNLWALEGLSAGFYNSVDPTHAKASRVVMAKEADKEGRGELIAYVERENAIAAEEVDELKPESFDGPINESFTPMQVDV